ncbi:MAG: hypothetical protein ACLFVN_04920 [Phycisphaeraceae bacterium]
MQHLSKLALAAVCLVSLWIVIAASGQGEAAPSPGEELARARDLLAQQGEVGPALEAMGDRLARDPAAARAVLDGLAAEGAEADLMRAELLFHCAEGFQPRRGGNDDAALLPTDEIGRRAAALLDSPDPAARALAEWAIDVRLSMACEGNFPRPWPDPAEAAWFARWEAVDGDQALADDYLRRAYLFGVHRSPAGLLEQATAAAERARQVAERVRKLGTPPQQAACAEHLAQMNDELTALEQMAAQPSVDMGELRRQYVRQRLACRQVVMQNPDLAFDRLLYAVRNGNDSFNITQGDLLDIFGADGEIYIQDGLHPGGEITPLLQGRLGPGHLRGVDLAWDAGRVLFSFAEQPEWPQILAEGREQARELVSDGVQRRLFNGIRGLNDAKGQRSRRAHLWELALDTGELRQLTDARWNDDYEPAYLPSGDIVFCSDRSNYGSQCAGNPGQDKMITNLYRARGDGSGVHPLSNNKDFDRYPRVTDDGKLMFLHWEYQERHLYLPHTLWQSRPDGTGMDAFYKQHVPQPPMSLRQARQVPGTDTLMAIACGHHVGAVGSVFLVDTAMGINEGAAMRNLTPNVSPTEGGYGPWPTVAEGGVRDAGGYYHAPYPLSDKSLLVSYSYNRPGRGHSRSYALYYVDVWGNKELIRRDKKRSVTAAMPLRARPVPPILVDATDPTRTDAEVYISNVNEGLEDVEPGTVKYIRIAQHMPWPCVRDTESAEGIAFDDLHYNPAGPWTPIVGFNGWSPARSIGVVPVEEDGSAYFQVPARQPVYFQALDENYMEVRRMRSNATFQPGETRGCIGCHETRAASPADISRYTPQAMQRPASVPEPPMWGSAAPPDFEQHVQPILDRNCVSCHGQQDPAGGIELSGRKVSGYNQSYRSMFGLEADEPTPARDFYINMWHRGDPTFTSENHRAWFKRYYNNELDGQLVAISNYKSGPEVSEPYQFGSTRSRLVTTLLEDPEHREQVELSREEWIGLVTWIDLNAFYTNTYTHFGSRQRVPVAWPDPFDRAPAGEWKLVTEGEQKKVVLEP